MRNSLSMKGDFSHTEWYMKGLKSSHFSVDKQKHHGKRWTHAMHVPSLLHACPTRDVFQMFSLLKICWIRMSILIVSKSFCFCLSVWRVLPIGQDAVTFSSTFMPNGIYFVGQSRGYSLALTFHICIIPLSTFGIIRLLRCITDNQFFVVRIRF